MASVFGTIPGKQYVVAERKLGAEDCLPHPEKNHEGFTQELVRGTPISTLINPGGAGLLRSGWTGDDGVRSFWSKPPPPPAGGAPELRYFGEKAAAAAASADDQFRLFNLERAGDEVVLVDPHESTPVVVGSAEAPDVRARIQLAAFNAGGGDAKSAHATLRFDVGQDELAQSPLRPLFWSIAAGLDLSNLIKGDPDAPKDYNSDFTQAQSDRPIEIGGGLCEIRFEVVRHVEKPWWREIFSFAKSRTGKALISAVGFPGIVNEAVDLIDKAFDNLSGATPQVLFRSAKMTFAMSKWARDEFSLGSGVADIGVMNQGFSVLVPQRHYAIVADLHPRFFASHGRLVAKGVTMKQFLDPAYVDPLANVPYAVLRIKSEEASLKGAL